MLNLTFHERGNISNIVQYVDMAMKHDSESSKLLAWVLNNIVEIAVRDSFNAVRGILEKIVREANESVIEDVVNALTNLKIHYPDEIDNILNSSGNSLLKEYQITVRSSESESISALSFQLSVGAGKLVKHLIHTQKRREAFAEAWACAAKCRSFEQWMQQVFMRIVNYVTGSDIYEVIPVD